jgi:hypothetical protein
MLDLLPPPIFDLPRPASVRRADDIRSPLLAFVPGMVPGFIASAPPAVSPPSLAFVGFTGNTSDLSAYTFTNHAIGDAAADRVVVVCVSVRSSGSSSVTSVSIGGNAATSLVAASGVGAIANFYALLVPSGTTATIVVNIGGSAAQSCAVAVWALTGTGGSTTPTATASSTSGDPSGLSLATANCAAVGACYGTTGGGGAITLSGRAGPDDYNDAFEGGFRRIAGRHQNLTAGATLSPSCDWGATPSASHFAGVSW